MLCVFVRYRQPSSNYSSMFFSLLLLSLLLSLPFFYFIFFLHNFWILFGWWIRYTEHEYHEITPQISHAVQEIHPIDTNNYGSDTTVGGIGNSSSNSNQQQQQPFSGNHAYDILPPGVDREPPPPGFENEVISPDQWLF